MDNNMENELVKLAKKQLFYQRISSVCIAGMFAVLICAVIILVPRVSATLENINSVAAKAEVSLENIDTMAKSMADASDNLDKLVADNAEGLSTAVKSISEVDFEGLNKAIQDLQDTVKPLATFMRGFN